MMSNATADVSPTCMVVAVDWVTFVVRKSAHMGFRYSDDVSVLRFSYPDRYAGH